MTTPRIDRVNTLDEWAESIQSLGTEGHLVTVLQTDRSEPHPLQLLEGGYADRRSIPDRAVRAAHAVAQLLDSSLDSAIMRRNPVVFGPNFSTTGLHADINIGGSAREALSPSLTTLYIASGAIRAYFKEVPIDALAPSQSPDYPIASAFFDGLDMPTAKSHNRRMIRPDKIKQFTAVDVGAGSVIAFPAAGDYTRGITAAAHQVETIPTNEKRISIALPAAVFVPRSTYS